MSANTSPVQQALELLTKTKEDVKVLLSDTDHGLILLSIESGLTNIINRLSHVSGVFLHNEKAVDFPPVTNFMGEEIKIPTIPTGLEDDITPTDKEIFLAKVDKLFNEFDSLPADTIINSYSSAEDVIVLRGVAKRAGVEGFDEAEITSAFIEKISAGIKQYNHDAAVDLQIQAQKEKDEKLNSLKEQLEKAQQEGADFSTEIAKAQTALASAKENNKPKLEEKLKGLIAESEENIKLQISLEEEIKVLSE